jgi:hypothetical protein
VGTLAALSFHNAGYVLYNNDAESHLDIARRVVDSRTPGYEQIGTVWLPVSHVFMLPFIGDMQRWQTGWAATLPGIFCFVLAGTMLYGAARASYQSGAAAACAALVFALNPNLLYSQSTPMNEHVFFAMQLGVLLFTLRFSLTQSAFPLVAAGMFAAAATLTRYDGWFLLPFTGLYILVAARERRLRAAFIFATVAGAGPLYWLAHNQYFFSNALDFYNGPYSAKAIQGNATYPGDGDLAKAVQYYGAAAVLCVGTPLAAASIAGTLAAIWKRAFWPLFFLSLGPLFYVVSMYSSGHTPIFVPHLYPHSYYNTRYGLALLPFAAFAVAGLAAIVPRRFAVIAAFGVVALAVAPWIAYPRAEAWITWKESQVNSRGRRAWTSQAADYLRDRYRPGAGILVSFGDQIGVLREAGIPLKEALHQGNGPAALFAFEHPDRFLREEWAFAIVGDPVSNAMLKLIKAGSPYVRVKLIEVKDAAPVEIYRRVRPMPSP